MHESRQDKTISEAGHVWMRAQEIDSMLFDICAAAETLSSAISNVLDQRTPAEVIGAGFDMDTAVAGLRDAVENL